MQSYFVRYLFALKFIEKPEKKFSVYWYFCILHPLRQIDTMTSMPKKSASLQTECKHGSLFYFVIQLP